MVDAAITQTELNAPNLVRQTADLLARIDHNGHIWLGLGILNLAASLLGLAMLDRFNTSL